MKLHKTKSWGYISLNSASQSTFSLFLFFLFFIFLFNFIENLKSQFPPHIFIIYIKYFLVFLNLKSYLFCFNMKLVGASRLGFDPDLKLETATIWQKRRPTAPYCKCRLRSACNSPYHRKNCLGNQGRRPPPQRRRLGSDLPCRTNCRSPECSR